MKIFLDDIRKAPKGWVFVNTVEGVISLFEKGFDITHLSLDHDLGEDRKTGYNLLCWIEREVYHGRMTEVPILTVHSSNPVGVRRMNFVIDSIKTILESRSID